MTPEELLDLAVELEAGVWQAFIDGDPEADEALLTEDFLGVYPTGFSGRAAHAAQRWRNLFSQDTPVAS